MKEVRRGMDLLSEKDREQVIGEIIGYFQTERGEEIGIIAAGDILDFFSQAIGDGIYNKAIEDSKVLLRKVLEGVDFEIDLLKKL